MFGLRPKKPVFTLDFDDPTELKCHFCNIIREDREVAHAGTCGTDMEPLKPYVCMNCLNRRIAKYRRALQHTWRGGEVTYLNNRDFRVGMFKVKKFRQDWAEFITQVTLLDD